MRYLADTHILLWAFEGGAKISGSVSQALRDRSSEVFFSPVSLWEIAIKYQTGKLVIHGVTPEEFLAELEDSFFEPLPLDNQVIASSYQVPRLHGDPFDRLLMWQAIKHDCTLLSADPATDQYASHGLRVVH
ncbi:MAG: type II toxin-antitoxin system VapC family toxin [Propionibacteriaceae bacterium]|jgi:PIN domain nuclease of toxin-antitoxin system|nr:type II toxin-antitoxin system VapC family toxin [Propionibacteriaceae bacterium]